MEQITKLRASVCASVRLSVRTLTVSFLCRLFFTKSGTEVKTRIENAFFGGQYRITLPLPDWRSQYLLFWTQ